MNIQQAKSIAIVDYLAQEGYQPAYVKGVNAWYLSPLRSERNPSFKVETERNLWYDFALGTGGTIIDLAMRLNSLRTIPEALACLAGKHICRLAGLAAVPFKREPAPSPYADISEQPLTKQPLISYLEGRAISLEVAQRECVELHYTLNGKPRYAIGFKNRTGGYELRNPRFKGSISPKDITVRPHIDHGTVAVFEGFFDYLSFIEANDGNLPDCIILNSIANAEKARETMSAYGSIHLYLDNDDAGHDASAKIHHWLGSKVRMMNFLFAAYNDLNEWHVASRKPN